MAKIPKTAPTEEFRHDSWEQHEKAILRTYIGGLDLRAIGDAGVLVHQQGAGRRGETVAQINTAAAARAKLNAGLVSHTITYADGTPIPQGEAGYDLIPGPYLDAILARLTELWAAWDTPPPEPKTAGDATRSPSFPVGKDGGRSAGRKAGAR